MGEHGKIILKEHARVFIRFLLQKTFCRPTLYKSPSTSLYVQHMTNPSTGLYIHRMTNPSTGLYVHRTTNPSTSLYVQCTTNPSTGLYVQCTTSKPSQPVKPPREETRGRSLRRAIRFAVVLDGQLRAGRTPPRQLLFPKQSPGRVDLGSGAAAADPTRGRPRAGAAAP